MINITLPDSSIKSFKNPISINDLAASIGPGLAKATVAGKINGELADASDLINYFLKLKWLSDQQLIMDFTTI